MEYRRCRNKILMKLAFVQALLFCFGVSFGQSVSTSIDKRSILIGEHIYYELKFTLPNNQFQIDLKVPDSIPHFDIINKKKVDTVDAKGNYVVLQKILFTSFDSGKWSFPAFAVKLRTATSPAVYTLNTDPITIDIGYSPADSSGQLRDIKPVIGVSIIDDSWIYIAIGVLLALIIGYLLYRYFKKRKKTKPLFDSGLSAYDEAMKALKKLQSYSLNHSSEIKEFHSQLPDVFRKYLSRREQRNFMNMTTGEILVYLKEQGAGSDLVSTVAEALRTSDAVKFARFQPAGSENERALEQVKASIEHINKSAKTVTTK
jgi:hypothetical protein